MSLERELTVTILDKNENVLGFLNNDNIEIDEDNELYKMRSVTITHSMIDVGDNDYTKYQSMIKPGNKIWRTKTCDGVSILYVIFGEISYNFSTNEITFYAEEAASELSSNKIFRNSAFDWKVNDSFILTYFGNFFDSGTLTGPGTATSTNYNGALTPLGILRKIEDKTGGEFQFRYEYDNQSNKIKRYIDYFDRIGAVHYEKISLKTNSTSINLTINEANTRIAAGPVGEPSSDTDDFHQVLKTFEDTVISKTTQIPLWVTKDDSGNEINGPLAYPPYAKPAGQNYVADDITSELVSNYNYSYYKEGSSSKYPRIQTFTTSETNIYNIYWECVDNLREYLEPEITIDCNVIDLKKLNDDVPEYFNVGDTVYIELPIYGTVSARIKSTIKNPRKLADDSITISNYQTGFVKDNYKSSGMINLK